MSQMKVFVSGAAGYIGSHTCLELIQAGYDVVAFDNLSNSSVESLKRVERLCSTTIPFIKGDIRDEAALSAAIQGCDAVIHFAGLKSVNESVENPDLYYDNNVTGSKVLLQVMAALGIKKIVFSSSATVYGPPAYLPVDEAHVLNPTNPYGQTKLEVEALLATFCKQEPSASVAVLRYFNPVGAHHSGQIGEDPHDIPNNLMPFISQVAVGKRKHLQVFGNDYTTIDGTGVRDYIHVVDLAKGHIKALDTLAKPGFDVINLGTGTGTSVLELIQAFEKASGKAVPFVVTDRRPGDVASCYADVKKACTQLGFKASYDVTRMCVDSWRWQQQNPNGYET